MIFSETKLKGAFVIDMEPREDDRGYFARAYDENEFAAHGLIIRFPQCNTSWNVKAGTLRGMHYQVEPHGEVKVVRCTKGRLVDVIVDLRPGSDTYLQHIMVELSQQNRTMLYVPVGFAHGYQALEDGTEAFYMVGEFYTPTHERAVRWNDPAFGIDWPIKNPILSPKDAAHADFQP
ncbi:MAG TPA: dTDP-4-dehydrorhamnose 3,5-epimerase [Fimbriimonadaceae bacterium]|nr:dTDP-4-dehydrorhamnose 3,5-epimerase [Fimbriimonadaceae bacterium]